MIMITKLKNIVFSRWDIWRATRGILGLVFIVAGSFKVDYILILSGAFLLGHALLNVCNACATNNCEIPKK